MLEIPAWLATAFGWLIAVLVTVIGYLIRFIASTSKGRFDAQEAEIKGLHDKLDKIGIGLIQIDRRFVEAELMATRQFVDKESYTRDYITMVGKVDTVHKRVDRFERGHGHGDGDGGG